MTTAPNPIRMPGSLDAISEEWLTSAMRSTNTIQPDSHVSKMSWELLGEGQGFLGDLARISMEYQGTPGPASAVLKIPTTKPENRGLGVMFSAYENEVRFYNELAQHLKIRMPQCYFADLEHEPKSAAIAARVLQALPERVTLWLLDRLATAAGKADRRYIVLMEDLGETRIGDQVAGATVAEAGDALDVLAEFHAAFWNSPLLNRDWIVRQDDTPLVVHGLYERAFPIFDERFRSQIDGPTRKVIDWVTANGPELLRRVGGGTQTLVHGDFRMDNITFYDGEESPVGMIDFQGVASGHPLTDVAYFLRPNLDPDDADAAEDDLLRRYHDALVKHGVTDYSWEALQNEWILAQLWVLHRGVILIGSLDLSHERGVQIVERAISRALRVAHRLDTSRALA